MTSFLYLNIYYYAEIYWGKKPVYIFGIKRGKKIVLVVLHQLAFLQYYQVMMKLYYY